MSRAINHAGWCVQSYTTAQGWTQESVTFATHGEALACFKAGPYANRRIYEVLS